MMRILILLPILATPAATSADEAPDDLIQRIERIWKARQDRCASGIIRWKQEESYETGAIASNDRAHSVVTDYEFAFNQDGCCACSVDGPIYDAEKEKFHHRTLREAICNGQLKRLFIVQIRDRVSTGAITLRHTLGLDGNADFEAPLLVFRPSAPEVSSFQLADWTVGPESKEINGRPCVHVVKQYDHLWLDPQRDYLPLRHEWRRRTGELYSQMDIDYAPHDVAGWAPETWRYSRMGYEDYSGQWHAIIMEGHTATVTELRLNVPVPDSRFDFAFPPGTRVSNELAGGNGIIREDGSYRPIELSEQFEGKSHDELMHSDPPSVVERRRRKHLQQIGFWSSIGVAIVGTLAIVIYYWRRHRAA